MQRVKAIQEQADGESKQNLRIGPGAFRCPQVDSG